MKNLGPYVNESWGDAVPLSDEEIELAKSTFKDVRTHNDTHYKTKNPNEIEVRYTFKEEDLPKTEFTYGHYMRGFRGTVRIYKNEKGEFNWVINTKGRETRYPKEKSLKGVIHTLRTKVAYGTLPLFPPSEFK
jgi:hypothetical protein